MLVHLEQSFIWQYCEPPSQVSSGSKTRVSRDPIAVARLDLILIQVGIATSCISNMKNGVIWAFFFRKDMLTCLGTAELLRKRLDKHLMTQFSL